MTLTTENNTKEYTANGSTDTFAYDFLILDEDDLKVYLDGVLQSSGYTVSGVGEAGGGDVVFSSPPADQTRVSLYRIMAMTQETDYLPYDPFPADTHEAALDKLTMLCQQVHEATQRAILAPIGGDPEVDFSLPAYDAGKAVMWDEVAKELTTSDDQVNGIVTAAQAAQTAAQAAKTAAEAAQAAAESAETNAGTSETNAAGSEAAADAAQTAAEAAQTAAEAAQTAAELAETGAETAETNAAASASAASDSETAAAASASAASDSETAAAASEAAAAASEAAAATYAVQKFVETYAPTTEGDDGDLWFQYEA